MEREKQEGSAAASAMVKNIILKEVCDWDDEVLARARFKDFSGQRSDWLSKYTFWRDLIISVARHLNIIAITPSEVKNLWFSRRSLTPLCIDQVLNLMIDEGLIVRENHLLHPAASFLATFVSRIKHFISQPTLNEDRLIVIPLMNERADELLSSLSQTSNSHSVLTMNTFQSICGGPLEANAVFNRLRKLGKAQFITLQKRETIQGFKVSFSHALTAVTGLDYDILHLTHTSEELNKKLAVIDQRYGNAKESALKALRSGAKKVAVKHAKEMKMMSESRVKLVGFINRVDEVLDAIYDCETTNKVSEAVRIGAEAMKNEAINGEEVERCLVDIEERIAYQKEIGESLAVSSVDDDDVQMELRELEMEDKQCDDVVDAMAKMDLRSSSPDKDDKPNVSKLILEANV